MNRLALAFSLGLAALPLGAGELAPELAPEPGPDDAPSGFDDGLGLFFRQLIEEMEPAMRDLAGEMEAFASGMEPMLRELARRMRDVTDYEPPEMLPNGDIIIRKRRPDEFGPGGEIEL